MPQWFSVVVHYCMKCKEKCSALNLCLKVVNFRTKTRLNKTTNVEKNNPNKALIINNLHVNNYTIQVTYSSNLTFLSMIDLTYCLGDKCFFFISSSKCLQKVN